MIPDILTNAIIYDIETFPNCFTCHAQALVGDWSATWEISDYRDDRHAFFAWLNDLAVRQTPMIGFNSVGFDYPVIHHMLAWQSLTAADIYAKAMSIIESNDRFSNTIWESDRVAPQVDLFKINHFDNRAKTTSLKALQINMRSQTVVESAVPFGTYLTREQIDRDLIPYNIHDVRATRQFALYCMPALAFRAGLIPQFGMDVLNYNDVKIGAKTLEQRLGQDVCYYRDPYGKRMMRQTPRTRIALAEIIFPYVKFEHPEFQRVLDYMRAQVLTPEDIEVPDAPIKTKGVFKNLIAQVGGLDFYFGTGGMHASVEKQIFHADAEWEIVDVDVAGMYPDIAVQNGLAPAHLGEAFVTEYRKIPIERKTHAKGTPQNASLKLAANGPWGQSINKYTVFFDPQYGMTIPINGQLMICMLAQELIKVPTLSLIACNTDGITFRVRRDFRIYADIACDQWERITRLTLEYASYSRMIIRDVNSYVAEDTDGKLKRKGAYWAPDPDNWAQSISNASPPSWHKDLGNVASINAAVDSMVRGRDVADILRDASDPFDFMCRARCDRASHLLMGDRRVQSTLRYYVAREGAPLVKVSPPTGPEGSFKRAPRVTEADYDRVMAETGGAWDARVCTQNKSTHTTRRMGIETGYLVAECNNAAQFDWSNVNYDWYVAEARKLIIT